MSRTRPTFRPAWPVDGRELALDYVFEPGQPDDGVTVRVPVGLLNQLDPAPFSWQVPGLRTELATELIRSLPKSLRRNLVPAAEFAERALAWLAEHPPDPAESLPVALGRALRALTGERVEAGDWDLDAVPDHLRMTFAVYPDDQPDGPPLATGKDLVQLRRALADEVGRTLAAAAPELSRTGLARWEFGDLAEQVTVAGEPHPVIGYPALVDEGATVGLAVLESPQRQRVSHLAGLRRLVLLNTPDPTTWVVGRLGMEEKLALSSSPYAGVPALLADARLASVGELIRRRPGASEVRTEAAFAALCDAVRVGEPDTDAGHRRTGRHDPHGVRLGDGRAVPRPAGRVRPRLTTWPSSWATWCSPASSRPPATTTWSTSRATSRRPGSGWTAC